MIQEKVKCTRMTLIEQIFTDFISSHPLLWLLGGRILFFFAETLKESVIYSYWKTLAGFTLELFMVWKRVVPSAMIMVISPASGYTHHLML